MTKFKSKLFDNKDLLIESNQNEIFYSNIPQSESSLLNDKRKRK